MIPAFLTTVNGGLSYRSSLQLSVSGDSGPRTSASSKRSSSRCQIPLLRNDTHAADDHGVETGSGLAGPVSPSRALLGMARAGPSRSIAPCLGAIWGSF